MQGERKLHAVNHQITLSGMSKEARDLLDTIMQAWEGQVARQRESNLQHEPTIYGFAYWLCRYSGLIQPATSQACDAGAWIIKPDGTFERVTEDEATPE